MAQGVLDQQNSASDGLDPAAGEVDAALAAVKRDTERDGAVKKKAGGGFRLRRYYLRPNDQKGEVVAGQRVFFYALLAEGKDGGKEVTKGSEVDIEGRGLNVFDRVRVRSGNTNYRPTNINIEYLGRRIKFRIPNLDKALDKEGEVWIELAKEGDQSSFGIIYFSLVYKNSVAKEKEKAEAEKKKKEEEERKKKGGQASKPSVFAELGEQVMEGVRKAAFDSNKPSRPSTTASTAPPTELTSDDATKKSQTSESDLDVDEDVPEEEVADEVGQEQEITGTVTQENAQTISQGGTATVQAGQTVSSTVSETSSQTVSEGGTITEETSQTTGGGGTVSGQQSVQTQVSSGGTAGQASQTREIGGGGTASLQQSVSGESGGAPSAGGGTVNLQQNIGKDAGGPSGGGGGQTAQVSGKETLSSVSRPISSPRPSGGVSAQQNLNLQTGGTASGGLNVQVEAKSSEGAGLKGSIGGAPSQPASQTNIAGGGTANKSFNVGASGTGGLQGTFGSTGTAGLGRGLPAVPKTGAAGAQGAGVELSAQIGFGQTQAPGSSPKPALAAASNAQATISSGTAAPGGQVLPPPSNTLPSASESESPEPIPVAPKLGQPTTPPSQAAAEKPSKPDEPNKASSQPPIAPAPQAPAPQPSKPAESPELEEPAPVPPAGLSDALGALDENKRKMNAVLGRRPDANQKSLAPALKIAQKGPSGQPEIQPRPSGIDGVSPAKQDVKKDPVLGEKQPLEMPKEKAPGEGEEPAAGEAKPQGPEDSKAKDQEDGLEDSSETKKPSEDAADEGPPPLPVSATQAKPAGSAAEGEAEKLAGQALNQTWWWPFTGWCWAFFWLVLPLLLAALVQNIYWLFFHKNKPLLFPLNIVQKVVTVLTNVVGGFLAIIVIVFVMTLAKGVCSSWFTAAPLYILGFGSTCESINNIGKVPVTSALPPPPTVQSSAPTPSGIR